VVAVPSATIPVTVFQYVEVPLVARTCPAVPVALFESRNSPSIERLVTIAVAAESVVVTRLLATVRLDVDAFPSVVCPVTVNVPLEASEDVAVIAPPVMILLERVVMYAVTALKSVAISPPVVVVPVVVSEEKVGVSLRV
jgi:hypothetical protein